MQNALDVAKYVLGCYWSKGREITNLKLQKILYYVQGYVSRRCNEAAFPQPIYNWPYGPVTPDVYFQFNQFHGDPIDPLEEEELDQARNNLKQDMAVLSVMDRVIDRSFFFTASQLVDKTHQEDPWMDTKEKEVIPFEQIARYFRTHDPLEMDGGR